MSEQNPEQTPMDDGHQNEGMDMDQEQMEAQQMQEEQMEEAMLEQQRQMQEQEQMNQFQMQQMQQYGNANENQQKHYFDSIETDEFVMPTHFEVEIRMQDN